MRISYKAATHENDISEDCDKNNLTNNSKNIILIESLLKEKSGETRIIHKLWECKDGTEFFRVNFHLKARENAIERSFFVKINKDGEVVYS